MWNWKSKLTILAVPAVLVVAGTAVVAQAAGPPNASPTASAQMAPAGTSTEAPETATEQVEANEPNSPGGGHTDPVGQADHQFDGVE